MIVLTDGPGAGAGPAVAAAEKAVTVAGVVARIVAVDEGLLAAAVIVQLDMG